ncbi:transketolase C-terminal domain-containing protein [Rhizobium sp. AAP116]|uniref:transketolase family protein n=1 Tax=Rhizobium sp. AAP116 TaxID=1523429 RepID=UPI0006B950F9|nr:transketolase C-terminal domain-containing protein [Rhizobium sp. AAP116]KPF57235.1 transketolase [Rhizobium sp. AAP116]
MREALSTSLVRLAQKDNKLLVLTGDHGYALFDEFRRVCPNQYINAGIAEQNMIGMAAGLARLGFRPFVYGLAAFVPVRVIEQIKLDVAHDELPVVFLGDGAGFVYSHLGTSHQSTEDIACTRAIPNLQVLSPADRYEMNACMDYSYKVARPVYIRIGKSDRGDVHSEKLHVFTPGGIILVRQGRTDRPGIIATGSMVYTAMQVAEAYDGSVWSAPFVKPLSNNLVVDAAKKTTGLITLEEHTRLGGLGSAVAEITADEFPTRVLRIGVNDQFSQHCGSYDYLLREHRIDVDSVRKKVLSSFNL